MDAARAVVARRPAAPPRRRRWLSAACGVRPDPVRPGRHGDRLGGAHPRVAPPCRARGAGRGPSRTSGWSRTSAGRCIEQMRAFSPRSRRRALRVYREWNHANTAALLLAYDGIEAAAPSCGPPAGASGIVTSKSHPTRSTSRLTSCRTARASSTCDRRRGHRAAQARPGADRSRRWRVWERTPAGACYVGDAPFDIRAGRAAGVVTDRRDLGLLHARRRSEAEGPTWSSRRRPSARVGLPRPG